MTGSKYIKCPRCELNYILGTEELCDVCKAEIGLLSNLLDSTMEEDDFTRELCPICKRNFINFDEEMCENCSTEKLKISDEGDDEEWRTYLDDEAEEQASDMIITLDELEAEEMAEDEEEEETEEFDYDYPDDDFDDDIDLDAIEDDEDEEDDE